MIYKLKWILAKIWKLLIFLIIIIICIAIIGLNEKSAFDTDKSVYINREPYDYLILLFLIWIAFTFNQVKNSLLSIKKKIKRIEQKLNK